MLDVISDRYVGVGGVSQVFFDTPTGIDKKSQKYIADPRLVLPQIEYWI